MLYGGFVLEGLGDCLTRGLSIVSSLVDCSLVVQVDSLCLLFLFLESRRQVEVLNVLETECQKEKREGNR